MANDDVYDVIVCGFGGAGACAAIEAHDAGARVLVLERFDGGGATRRSGGVIYAGGGTDVQRRAGVSDTTEAMHAYLADETSGAVSPEALRRFCEESPAQIRWLEALGLSFEPRAYEPKTTQPPDGYGLYYSGNERQRAELAPPAARGHVPRGRGMTGNVLFAALARAVAERGIEVRRGTQVVGLTQGRGRVSGVSVLSLPDRASIRKAHAALTQLALTGERGRAALAAFEARVGKRHVIEARRGVVLATGGFVFSHALMERYAPAYAGCMPLGTPGDDGRGIELARDAGGALLHMDRCAASRFFAPPEAFTKGVLVDLRGERIADETLYGATLSAHIAEHGGRAFLILDQRIVDEAERQRRDEENPFARPMSEVLAGDVNHLLFRHYCAWINLHVNRVRADDLGALARETGLPEERLRATLRTYDEGARAGIDALGKARASLAPLESPPYYAVRCDLDSRAFPGPCITLGGVRVDERTGAVLRGDGTAVDGLHAAGRTAAGVASRSYVSGLSLADCIHSGRRAGRAVAGSVARVDPVDVR